MTGATGRREHPERPEPLLHQDPNVIGANDAPELVADPPSDLIEVLLSIGFGGDQVEQSGEPHDLAVVSAGEVNLFLKSRAFVLADKLGALR
jgi:hypothetical protein